MTIQIVVVTNLSVFSSTYKQQQRSHAGSITSGILIWRHLRLPPEMWRRTVLWVWLFTGYSFIWSVSQIDVINDTIARVDELTGERQANFVKSQLEYLDPKHRSVEVEISRKIICSGQLKTNRGPVSIYHFLFSTANYCSYMKITKLSICEHVLFEKE